MCLCIANKSQKTYERSFIRADPLRTNIAKIAYHFVLAGMEFVLHDVVRPASQRTVDYYLPSNTCKNHG